MRTHPTLKMGFWATCFSAVVATSLLSAQDESVRPGVNKPFENPDVAQFVERFESEGREIYDQRQAIIKICRLKGGASVADIGAGTGLFTRLLAAKVGAEGRVYAVDISDEFVDHVEKTCREEKLDNVVGVVCTADSAKLAPASIDVAFICATYHHFEFPHKTMRSIHRALRPGGEVVVVDYERIEGASSDWILGHVRAGKETVVKEILESGFELLGEEKLLKENYVLRFRKHDGQPRERNTGAIRFNNGVFVHHVQSPYQSGTTTIKVLVPDELSQGERCRALYVLPVEAGDARRWGDAMAEIRRHDLHNEHRLVCVMPTFSQLPWYADHPHDPHVRQESYLLHVVLPLVEKNYPVRAAAEGRLLVGFSKSGWGAYSLLLRSPDKFAAAAAWDAPLAMTAPGRYGSSPIFATQENFDQYRIDTLLERRTHKLHGRARLALLGYGNFRRQHQTMHAKMVELGVAHQYADGPPREHSWESGWLKEAVGFLASRH